MTIRIHVIGHTHWDREWYHGAGRFRVRLARMMDELLDLLSRRPDYPSFLLDGQAVLLDDYAALRPERLGELASLLATGRLETGPWWVLPDELLVSAEALVRNLEEGRATVARHGGVAMPVGYTPDAFGHSGALPLVLSGFGIETAVLWRGFGGEAGQEKDLYRWASADGSEVVMAHLPQQGYELGVDLPAENQKLAARWSALSRLFAQRARAPVWLVLSGADHHGAQPDLPEAVQALAVMAPACHVTMGLLEEFAAYAKEWARVNREAVPLVKGELLGGRRHAWLLSGTHSSRISLKQSNARCQRILERYAEPLASHAARKAPNHTAGLAGDLRAAWRTLLMNHPHDSICGTSHDSVHREMAVRFGTCADESSEAVSRALDVATGHDPIQARAAAGPGRHNGVLVFNPWPRPFSGVVVVEVARFRGDVAVGQGSRAVKPRRRAGGRVVLKSREGTEPPVQELERRIATDLIESPRHYPDCDQVELVSLAVDASDLPALGISAWGVHERAGRRAVPAPQDPVVVDGQGMRNSGVLVRVEADGTLVLADGGGESYAGLAVVEDSPDKGDSYTSSARAGALLRPDDVAVRVVHQGPLRGELEVARLFREADLDLRMRVSLDSGSPVVTIVLTGENRRHDHRLRVAFPLGVRLPRVVADGHFGPVERKAVEARSRQPGELEAESGTAPMQRFVSAALGNRGLTVLTEGLPEYQVRTDGTMLVTLLRSFGELSKADLPERPGHAGWPTATPEGQCIGPFTARLGVLLHDEAALDSRTRIEDAAERFHARPEGYVRRALLRLPADVPGPVLEGDGLVMSAMKPASEKRGVVLRCFNVLGTAVQGAWRVPWRVKEAELVRLDEALIGPLAVEPGGVVRFEAGPRAVVSIRIS